MSRPPTPPSKAPKKESEWRFHHIDAPTEWIEDYRPGGLHPIHLSDTFDGDRYKVLRKLGYGSFSTVWLVRDTQESRYVAVKVSVAKASETKNELGILEHLGRHHDQRGAQCLIELLHSFEHKGPNGHHICLVFPVMGPSASTMERKFRTSPMRSGRYPLWIAKSMLKQLLLGLSFLHHNGVVHTDIQPGNILFSLPNIDSLPEYDLQTDINQSETISDPVQRVDGKIDLWSPRYTYIPQPLTSLATVKPGFTVRISDMGGDQYSRRESRHSRLLISPILASLIARVRAVKPVTPVALCAPELIFAKSWDVSIDIWSFGCLLFEFITGTPLFVIGTWGVTDEEIDDDHVKQLIATLGPLPAELRAKWPRYSSLHSDDGIEVETQPSLETLLKTNAPPEMDAGEVEVVGMLLREILQYNPAKRLTVADLLKNPWFEAIEESKKVLGLLTAGNL